jgi:hypothetical protein
MKIIYDKEADALYIRLLEGEYESRVVRLGEEGGGRGSHLQMSLLLGGGRGSHLQMSLLLYPRRPDNLTSPT